MGFHRQLTFKLDDQGLVGVLREEDPEDFYIQLKKEKLAIRIY